MPRNRGEHTGPKLSHRQLKSGYVHRDTGKPPPGWRTYNPDDYVPTEEYETQRAEEQGDVGDSQEKASNTDLDQPTQRHDVTIEMPELGPVGSLHREPPPDRPAVSEPVDDLGDKSRVLAEASARRAELILEEVQRAQARAEAALSRVIAEKEAAERTAAADKRDWQRLEHQPNADLKELKAARRAAEESAAEAESMRAALEAARVAAEAAEEEEQRRLLELQKRQEAAMRERLRDVCDSDAEVERMIEAHRAQRNATPVPDMPGVDIPEPPVINVEPAPAPSISDDASSPADLVVDDSSSDDGSRSLVPAKPPPKLEVRKEPTATVPADPPAPTASKRAITPKDVDVDPANPPSLVIGPREREPIGSAEVAKLDNDLRVDSDDEQLALQPEPSRTTGKELVGVAGLASRALSTMVKGAHNWFTGLDSRARVIVVGICVAILVMVSVSAGGDSGVAEKCKTPAWAPHTIKWTEDCNLATSDKRTIVKVDGGEYNLMAQSLDGITPDSVLYSWMLVGSGGNDAYTYAPLKMSGLIPQTREWQTVAAKGLGLPESSLTKVNATKTKFGGPDHTSSWLMAVWSLNRGWADLASQPAIRNKYQKQCEEWGVKLVHIGYQVTLCQLLLHVLPPNLSAKPPKGKNSAVELIVDLARQWKYTESPIYENIESGLKKLQLKRANLRACKSGNPGVIKGVDCPREE